MNVLESIFNRIFPANHPAVAGVVPTETIPAPAGMAGGMGTVAGVGPMGTGSVNAGTSPMMPAPTRVDVASVLGGMAETHKEQLNWRTSIVDLMKLLGLDSSLQSREQLAKELHYPGDTKDTAAMNTWLVHEVMEKLEENGGEVPAELKH